MVDGNATADMARIMAAMSGTSDALSQPSPAQASQTDKDAMKTILERFYRATDDAVSSPDVETSAELRNAMLTERTVHGVRIGQWEIRVVDVNEKLKTYDVLREGTNETIARGLLLYEAAHALTKLLNAGVAINTPRLREVLALEEAYAKHRADAVSFKRKMRRLNESVDPGYSVAEDRYNLARDRAVEVRAHLRKLNEEIR